MATYYWVGGAGTWNSTTTTNWATSSNGAGGAGYPTILDDVVFDSASGTGTVTCTVSTSFCRDFTVTASQALTISGAMTCAGNLFLPSGGSLGVTGLSVTFIAGSAKTITNNGRALAVYTFNNPTGSWTLQDAISVGGVTMSLAAGTVNTNNQSVTLASFTTSGTAPKSLVLGSTTFTVTSSGGGWTTTAAGFTLVPDTSTVVFSGTVILDTGGLTFNNATFSSNSGGTILGNNQFNNLTVSGSVTGVTPIQLGGNQIVTGTLTAAGASNIQRVAFYSNTAGTTRTLTVAAWSASPANLDFRDIAIAGAVGTLSGTSIGNCGNNSGITFTAPKTVYWNLTGTQFWSATGWATLSAGTPNAANFPLAQDTSIFDNAGAMTSVSFNASWNIGTIDASQRTSAATLTGISQSPNFYGNMTLGTGITVSGTSVTWNFSSRGTQTINTAGVTITNLMVVNGGAGTVRLLSNVTNSFGGVVVTLTSGTLDLNNFALNLTSGNSNFTITASSVARSIAFGSSGSISIATINATSSWLAGTLTNFTVSGTPTVNLTGVTTNSKSISHGDTGGNENNAISVNVPAGSNSLSMSGVFKNINLTGFSGLLFVSGSNTTIYGDLLISTETTGINGGTLFFAGTSAVQRVTSNGKTFDIAITISGINTTLLLQDAFTHGSTRAFTLNSGSTFNANAFSATLGTLAFSATPSIINLVSNTLTCAAVTHTAGNLVMSAGFKINVTNTYTITAGTLDFGNQSVTFGGVTTTGTGAGTAVRTINLGSGTITITGPGATSAWNNAISSATVINAGTSTISMTSASAKTFVAGNGQTYYNLVQAGAGTLTIVGPATFNIISNTVQPTTILFSNTTFTVASLNLNGTAGNLVTLAPSTTIFTIAYRGSTVNTMNYMSVSAFIGSTSGIFFATNSTNGGGNTNLTFGSADTTPRYWVGGSGVWTNTATANWATGTGGTGGASAPTIETDVYFDASSNVGTGAFTVTLTGTSTSALVCRDLTISGLDGVLTWTGTGTPQVYGSWFYPATNITSTTSGAITFGAGTTGKTVTSNGQRLTSSGVTFDGAGGGWTLADAVITGVGSISVVAGSFSTGNFNMAISSFSSNSTSVRTINFGSSTISCNTNGAWQWNSTNLTFNAGTSTINFLSSTPLQTTGALTWYNVNYTDTSSSGTNSLIAISGSNTFNNLAITPSNGAGITYVAIQTNQIITGTLSCSGASPVRRICFTGATLNSSFGTGVQRTLTVNSFSSSVDIDFRDIQIAGAAATVSGTRLGDCGGNSGIAFAAPKTVYWNQAATGVFTDTVWAASEGGAVNINNFPLPQDTAAITNTGLTAGNQVTLSVQMNYPAIDTSARTTSMTLSNSGVATNSFYGSFLIGTGVTVAGTVVTTFYGRGSNLITSNGKSLTFIVNINAVTGTYTLTDALSITGTNFRIFSGNFNSANQSMTVPELDLNDGQIPTGNYSIKNVILGTSTITFFGTQLTPLQITISTNLTLSAAQSTFLLTNSTTTQSLNGGGRTLGNLIIGGGSSTIAVNFSSTGTTWNNISTTRTAAWTLRISNSNTTINFNNFNVSGNPGALVTLDGGGATNVFNYTGSTEAGGIDYITITGVNTRLRPAPAATGTVPFVWYLGANSTITSEADPATTGAVCTTSNRRVYIISSTTPWTVPTTWNNNNNIMYLIGGGGGAQTGAVSGNNRAASGGGGGGGFSQYTNVSLTPGSTVSLAIGSSSSGVKGLDTYFNAVYWAGGGQAGTATTAPASTGGAGGAGLTFNGGAGGAGSAGTVASAGHGGGGGGGAGGPLGTGGAGGTGYGNNTVAANIAGGGGGGNGGGSNGGGASSALGGNGGNNASGVGGGLGNSGTGNNGTLGGGGSGMAGTSGSAPAGGQGKDILNTLGGAGGCGGLSGSASIINPIGFGSGARGCAVAIGGTSPITSQAGSPGAIFIVYEPETGIVINNITISEGVTING